MPRYTVTDKSETVISLPISDFWEIEMCLKKLLQIGKPFTLDFLSADIIVARKCFSMALTIFALVILRHRSQCSA